MEWIVIYSRMWFEVWWAMDPDNGFGQWRGDWKWEKKEMIKLPRCGYFICNCMNSYIRMWREIPFKNNCKIPPFLFIAVAIIVWREHHLLSTKVKGWDPLIWELNLTLILSQPFLAFIIKMFCFQWSIPSCLKT